VEPNGFWQRSATKAAVAMIAFAWMPVIVAIATLKDASPGDVEFAIRTTLEAGLAAFGVTRWAAPSAPLPPPK
jgi:hypothetical protein